MELACSALLSMVAAGLADLDSGASKSQRPPLPIHEHQRQDRAPRWHHGPEVVQVVQAKARRVRGLERAHGRMDAKSKHPPSSKIACLHESAHSVVDLAARVRCQPVVRLRIAPKMLNMTHSFLDVHSERHCGLLGGTFVDLPGHMPWYLF